MYRFLLTRRWLGLLTAVLVVSTGCVLMGLWQVDRLSDRHERNDLLARNLDAEPVPPDRLLGESVGLAEEDQYRRVRIRGTYDVAEQLLVRTRPYRGRVGFYVLTPLRPESGPALLVNRGWVPPGETATNAPTAPDPPGGTVTVTARLRLSEDASSSGSPPAGQVTRIHVPSIADALPYPVHPAYGDLASQQPTSDEAPLPLPEPEPAEGPHLAYAFQWFLFAFIAIVGVGVLARREEADNSRVGGRS